MTVLLAMVVVLFAFVPAASATKYIDSFFGNPTTSTTPNTGGFFNTPGGIAVNDATGAVYVVDRSKHRIQQFDAANNFVRAWGADVLLPAGGSDFEVCEVADDCKIGVTTGTGTGGQLNTPQGIAVNQATGHVYVTEGSRFRVQEFTATGQFVRAWGKDVIVNTGTPANSNGTGFEVCDTTAGNTPDECKIGVSDTVGAAGTFATAFTGYPSVVPAGAPNAGNVLVADPGNRRVQEFTATGEFVRAFGWDVVATGPGNDVAPPVNQFEICVPSAGDVCKAAAAGGNDVGRFGANTPTAVAADFTGAIYAVEFNSNFRVQKLSGPQLEASVFAATDLGGGLGNASGPHNVIFDPSSGRVLVSRGYISSCGNCTPPHLQFFEACRASGTEYRILEFNTSGARRDVHMSCAGLASPSGIAIRPSTGELYASSTSGGHRVYRLDQDGITPAVSEVNPAVGVTASSASLSGTVNPNSIDNAFAPTFWKLQFSENGTNWVTASSGQVNVADTNTVNVTGQATGLRPNTSYRTRVVTEKPFGNPEISSPELTFFTDAVPPEVRTTSTMAVGETTAVLSARINPHSTSTSYRFEWGKQGSFTNITPAPDAPVGSGPNYVLVSQTLSGLEPGATYQFRAVATSASQGATQGPTRSFTTATPPAGGGGRAYELVSPAYKVGGQGIGDWYRGPASHSHSGSPASVGDRFASSAHLGGILVDGAFAWAQDWALGERTPSGWVNRPAFNRSGGHGEGEYFRLAGIGGESDDLSLMLFATNQMGMRIFPEMEEAFGSNPVSDHAVLREWQSGRWEVFAPFSLEQNATEASFGAIRFSLVAPDGDYALTFGQLRGVGGVADPTHHSWPDLVCAQGPPVNQCNHSVYIDDVSAGLSDTFPGDGIRSLVNVCTGSAAARTAIPTVDGSAEITAGACPSAAGPDSRLISPRGASVQTSTPGTISADGARVFFLSPDEVNSAGSNNLDPCSGSGAAGTACPPQLYVRQRLPGGEVVTRWISRSRSQPAEAGAFGGAMIAGQASGLMARVFFEGASRDGDKVFFSTASPLTPDDPNGGTPQAGGVTAGTASSSSVDLYMYDLPDAPGADPGDGVLTRISSGPTGIGDVNVPAGSALRFLASDGDARVYFAAAAGLPDAAGPSNGTITSPAGTPSATAARNLYLYDAALAAEERWRFVARLPVTTPLGSCASTAAWNRSEPLGPAQGGGVTAQGNNCLKGTADGRFVTFMTDGRLTADDPDEVTGDLYAYDAERDDLTRISAAQGGVGGSYVCVTGSAGGSTPVGTRCNGDTGVTVGNRPRLLGVAAEPPVAGDRVAFFESASRLLPEDHNDVYDVYQWRNGELSLISTGAAGADHALYRGNDVTGRNVYLSTRDRLTWQDHDSVLDVYVARTGSDGIPQPPPPPACAVLADVCQGSVVGKPVSVAPRTNAASGGGNVSSGVRNTLQVAGLSTKARRQVARTGRLTLRVRTSRAGLVRALARARIGKRTRRVARNSVQVRKAGAARLTLRLNRAAKRQLKAGRNLNLSIHVRSAGARPRTITIRLPGARS